MTLPGGIWKRSAGAKCAEDGCRSVGFDMFLRWSQESGLRWFSMVLCHRWFCLICVFSEKETCLIGLISGVCSVISVKFGRVSSSSWLVDCPQIGLKMAVRSDLYNLAGICSQSELVASFRLIDWRE